MFAETGRRWVAAGVATLIAPLLIGAHGVEGMFEVRVLAAHNQEREAAGVGALQWDPALARSAQAWGAHLAATGAFEHAPERRFDPQGENLWAGTRGSYSLEEKIGAWIREKRYYRRGVFPDNSTTRRVEDVGHYTQLMWRDTDRVGCAEVAGAREDYLVCRYSNAGNYVGDVPF